MTVLLEQTETQLLKPQCITPSEGGGCNGEYFFGYFDKCPWNQSQRYILAQRAGFSSRMPTPDDKLEIGVVEVGGEKKDDGRDARPTKRLSHQTPAPPDTSQEAGRMPAPQFQKIDTTRAWSWQQGAMLQWYPKEPENTIIYNDFRDGKFLCVVKEVGEKIGGLRMTGETPVLPDKVLPRAVGAVSPDGKWAGCLNFARLHDVRPGYGYCNTVDPYRDELAPEDNGLEIMDMETGEVKQIISLAELAGNKVRTSPNQQSMRGAKHWINHILFSPNSQRMIFLHRWAIGNNPHQTRLYTVGIDGNDLRLINDDTMTSHFDWEDDSHIIAWARQEKIGDRYFRFEDKNNKNGGQDARPTARSRSAEIIGEDVLTHLGDGHCTVSPDRKWMLTDTYPDENMIQHLILFNLRSEKALEIGKFKSIKSQTPMRCDLHPRFSRDGKQICIDSTCNGNRKMYVIDISKII